MQRPCGKSGFGVFEEEQRRQGGQCKVVGAEKEREPVSKFCHPEAWSGSWISLCEMQAIGFWAQE